MWLARTVKKAAKKAVKRSAASAWKTAKKAVTGPKLKPSEKDELTAWRFWGRSLGSLSRRLRGAGTNRPTVSPNRSTRPERPAHLMERAEYERSSYNQKSNKPASSSKPKKKAKTGTGPRKRAKGERGPADPRFLRHLEKHDAKIRASTSPPSLAQIRASWRPH